MIRSDIRLFLTDLDGTLLQSDHATISPRTRDAIDALRKAGVTLCACTGRPAQVLPPAIEELDFDYVISCNGACCKNRHTGEIVFTAYLTLEQAQRAWAHVRQVDAQTGWFFTECITVDRMNFDRWETRLRPRWHRAYYATDKLRVVETPDVLFAEGVPHLEKLNMYDVSPDTPEKVIAPLTAMGDYTVTSSLGRNLEITAAAADKGPAMLTLCDHLGITPAQAVAFGDGGNDVNMLRLAGFGVAMGNAKDAVRAHAQYLTLTNDEDGVADFLEKHIL